MKGDTSFSILSKENGIITINLYLYSLLLKKKMTISMKILKVKI